MTARDPAAMLREAAGGAVRFCMDATTSPDPYRRILGLEFFAGTASGAVHAMRRGGLLIAPSAPVLKDLDSDAGYREAALNADLLITDSAFMVLIWNLLKRDHLKRLSGLEYLVELLRQPSVRQAGNTLWIMAGAAHAENNLRWLRQEGITVPEGCVYHAPRYGPVIDDPVLLKQVRELNPEHIVLTIGGGNQERVGLFLKRNLQTVPAIHCIGAAIAFLSGDQVQIPMWADRLYLGWLFRTLSKPKLYLPRYWHARKLLALMWRYGSELPPLRS